jgi:hypothetical protein
MTCIVSVMDVEKCLPIDVLYLDFELVVIVTLQVQGKRETPLHVYRATSMPAIRSVQQSLKPQYQSEF